MLVYLNFCRREGSMPIVISQLIPDTAQAHLTSSFFSFLYYAVTQTYFIPSTTQLDMQNSNITLIFFFNFFFFQKNHHNIVDNYIVCKN